MALKVYINTDVQDLTLGSSGVDWVEFAELSDKLLFTAGNPEVSDGANIPTASELISAGIELTGSEVILSEYILQDTSEALLKSINNMGNLDKSYVIAFDFDDITASEPVLEVWDDTNINTVDNILLGNGTPSASFIRGITTTISPPGTNWIAGATKMAGSADGNFLYLNDQNGFLTIASTLYCNLAVVVPASQLTGFGSDPVFAVKWLEN